MSFFSKIKSFFDKGFQLLYPEDIKCIACDRELDEATPHCLCPDCLRLKNSEFCLTCGRPKHDLSDYCDACRERREEWYFNLARSSLNYDGNIKMLIYRFKYGGERFLAKYIARLLFDTYSVSLFDADIITFVPLHPKREKNRGYNQSRLLAAEFGALLNKPVVLTLSKLTNVKNMARMGADERKRMIIGSFALNSPQNMTNIGRMSDITCDFSLKNKHVLLIDDVLTTGATANECARILKKGGCASVFVLTAASVNRVVTKLPHASKSKLFRNRQTTLPS
jgi:competence protein ComFC